MYKQNKENKICFNKPVINVLLVKYFYPFWIIFQNKSSVCIKFQVYYTCLKLFIDTWLKVKVAQSCLTLCNPGRILQARILKWVGSLSLLQGIFPTQGLNPDLLHCRQILYHLSHQGSPWYSLRGYIHNAILKIFCKNLWGLLFWICHIYKMFPYVLQFFTYLLIRS